MGRAGGVVSAPRREMRRDNNALFSHVGQQGRVLVSLFPCFPFLAAFFKAVLEGETGGLEEEATIGSWGWGKPNNPTTQMLCERGKTVR